VTSSSQSLALLGSTHLKNIAHTILNAPVLAEAVQSLDPLQAYLLVRELGVEKAAAVLQVCSQEQWQTCVDLACWEGETPNASEIEAWLSPFLQHSHQALAEAFLRLEEPLQIWYLAQRFVVLSIEDKDQLPDTGRDVEYLHTPDGFFVLELQENYEEDDLHPFVLVKALYSIDAENMFRLLTAAQWELPSDLEESAFHFRTARLLDIGFKPLEEALHIFARPSNTSRTHTLASTPALPVLYTEALAFHSPFTQAVSSLPEGPLRNVVLQEWMSLLNDAVIAYAEPPRDMQHLMEIFERVHHTLCLGMQAYQPPVALSHTPTVDIFRKGYEQTLLLKTYALQLLQDPVLAHAVQQSPLHASDEDQNNLAFVKGLIQKRPLHVAYDQNQPHKTKAFQSLEELQEARNRLDAWADTIK
jgi:hypothetical protein